MTSLSSFAGVTLKVKYGINPDILEKIYLSVNLIEEFMGEDSTQLIMDAIYRSLRMQQSIPQTEYHEEHRILLVAHEIYVRLKKAINDGHQDQVKLYLQDKLSLYNLGRTNVECSMITFEFCISCGDKLSYNPSSKKFSCNTCYCEYQS